MDSFFQLENLKDSTATNLVAIALTLAVTVILNSLLRSFIHVPSRLDTRRGRTYVSVIRNVISLILFAIALHIIFLILDVNIAPLLASAGIVGITIGIGARNLVEDLIAGFFLLTQDTIAIGDYVNVGGGAFEGTIEDIGFRTIKIRGMNGTLIILPTGQVRQVINYSRGRSNIFVDLPVKADQDVDKIIKALTAIINEMKTDKKMDYRIAEGSYVHGVQNIAAGNALIIRVVLITSPSLRFIAEKEYRYRVVKTFKKEKLQFA